MAMTACIAQWSEQHSVMQGRMAELNLMKATRGQPPLPTLWFRV